MAPNSPKQLDISHPITQTRSDPNNPYPTTFVQADTSSFKQVVQMLTGSNQPHKPNNNDFNTRIPPQKPKQSFKLYERRNSMKNFKISPLIPGFIPSSKQDVILSPSMLDFPSLALSPVTPLIPDPFTTACYFHSVTEIDSRAEERAIAEKGFYLHKSPATTPRESEPRLLPLFPVTSPKLASSTPQSSIP